MSLAIQRRRGLSEDGVASVLPGLRIAAAASLGAGAIHAAAAGVHAEHVGLARLFIVFAAAQLLAGGFALLRPSRAAAWAMLAINAARGRRVGAHTGHRDQLDRRPADPRGAAVRRRGVRRVRRPRGRRRARCHPHRLAARRRGHRPDGAVLGRADRRHRRADRAGDARRRHVPPHPRRRSGGRARPRLGTLGRLRVRRGHPDHAARPRQHRRHRPDDDVRREPTAHPRRQRQLGGDRRHEHDDRREPAAHPRRQRQLRGGHDHAGRAGHRRHAGAGVAAAVGPDPAGRCRRRPGRHHRAGGPGDEADPGHARRAAEVRRSRRRGGRRLRLDRRRRHRRRSTTSSPA